MGNKKSFGGVSEKKGKVRVRGKVRVARRDVGMSRTLAREKG